MIAKFFMPQNFHPIQYYKVKGMFRQIQKTLFDKLKY